MRLLAVNDPKGISYRADDLCRLTFRGIAYKAKGTSDLKKGSIRWTKSSHPNQPSRSQKEVRRPFTFLKSRPIPVAKVRPYQCAFLEFRSYLCQIKVRCSSLLPKVHSKFGLACQVKKFSLNSA